MTTQHHLDKLKQILQNLGSVAVAFSSGVDSTFLLKVAHDTLGNNRDGNRVVAVTARSPLFPDRELDDAVQFTQKEGIEHIIVDFDALTVAGFAQNPTNRCYLCKKELFIRLQRIAAEHGIAHVVEGSNADDVHDYRPGKQAIAELGIASPLQEAGLTKQEIRQLSAELGLPTWNKPSFACLASRIPYGEEITEERLAMIEAAERYLLDTGFHQVRVRFHSNLARIETDDEGLERLLDKKLREEIHCRLKALGFVHISADLLGYRTGSMDEMIDKMQAEPQS